MRGDGIYGGMAPDQIIGWQPETAQVLRDLDAAVAACAGPFPAPPATADVYAVAARVANWLDEHNGAGGKELGLRIMKVGEEFGEAVTAWIGVTGQNPRTGETHTDVDVAGELADVVLAALVAIVSLGHDPAGVLATRAGAVAARLDDQAVS